MASRSSKLRQHKSAGLIAVAGLTAVALALGSSAGAHWLADTKVVWENLNGKCLKNRSEISDGKDQGGYTKVNGFAQKEVRTPTWTFHCQVGWERYLKVRTILQVRESGEWERCRVTKWKYKTATEIQQERYWNAPCGDGWYRAIGRTFLQLNGKWKGGGNIGGGKHYLKR